MAKTAIPDLPPIPNDPEPAPITAGKLLPKGELIDLAAFTAKRAEKLGQTIATLTAGAEARAADVAKSLSAAGFDPKAQADAADKARAKARAEIIAASSEARWAEIKQLVAAAEGLALTEALYMPARRPCWPGPGWAMPAAPTSWPRSRARGLPRCASLPCWPSPPRMLSLARPSSR